LFQEEKEEQFWTILCIITLLIRGSLVSSLFRQANHTVNIISLEEDSSLWWKCFASPQSPNLGRKSIFLGQHQV
jgi:hypothetical protein